MHGSLGVQAVDTAQENIVEQRDLFPEEPEEKTPDGTTSPTAGATVSASVAQPPPHHVTPNGLNLPAAQHPEQPTAAGRSVEEAVVRALCAAGRPLVFWMLAKASGIEEHILAGRIHDLVREGRVKRIDAADAVRYTLPPPSGSIGGPPE